MIIPKKSAFTDFEWRLIKKYLEGHLGEIHHIAGKSYEKLAYLKVLTVDQHRGNGHKKYIHGIPEEETKENIEYWKELLKDDYEWFVLENLVCD